MSHVLKAYEEMQNSKTVKVLKGLRKFEIIVILALWLELKANKSEKVLMEKVQDRCEAILLHMQQDFRNNRKLPPNPTQDGPTDMIKESEVKTYENWNTSILTTTMFREIVKRLQAFGLINLIVESNKITENCHLQIYAYFDELKNAFCNDEIYLREKAMIELHGE